MARTYLIETFGCQMNVHDSERMSGLLEAAGYEPVCTAEEADVVVINTCSVREHAEEKLFTRLGELRRTVNRLGERPLVVVAGCVAQQEGADVLKRAPGVEVIVGTQRIRALPDLVEASRKRRGSIVDLSPQDDVTFPLGLARRGDPVRALVTIIEGCNEFCSFCVVPYTRGHERMRPLSDILAEVREAVDSGRCEIQLLGQIVNHYEAPDTACDFAGLLEAVSAVPGVRRVRFASPHPRHVTPSLIEAIRTLPAVCKHLHLPVQSGSTRVLQRMRRRYSRDEYLDLVSTLRATIPGISLSTDVIVGFPGESDEDFEDTLTLVERVRFHSMFSFKYSTRPRTLAAIRMPDDVDEREKTRRIVALQTLQRRIQLELHEAAIGSQVEVLVDSISRRRDGEVSGRTTGNTVVNFPGTADWLGRLLSVRVLRAGPHSLSGELVDAPGLTVALPVPTVGTHGTRNEGAGHAD
jgi:tRNA-2-methylthio-N6-dimethylallyladenosine synthase